LPVGLVSAEGEQQGQPASCNSVGKVLIIFSDTVILLLNARRLGHKKATQAVPWPDKYLQRNKHNA
jgi:hypothetical protein